MNVIFLSFTISLGLTVILGIAIGMMFTISPLWIGETCRPELRGFFLCFFNTSIVFGQFAMYASSVQEQMKQADS